jgi:hypothetical protein
MEMYKGTAMKVIHYYCIMVASTHQSVNRIALPISEQQPMLPLCTKTYVSIVKLAIKRQTKRL